MKKIVLILQYLIKISKYSRNSIIYIIFTLILFRIFKISDDNQTIYKFNFLVKNFPTIIIRQ